MNLDPETCYWYKQQAEKEIERLVQSLRKEQTEESTRMTRAKIVAMETIKTWKPTSAPEPETDFGL